MKADGGGVHVGTKDEIMFRLFCVSESIFLGLTDRPINLIYRVSPHPLTSSTGLLSNNELLRLGTIAVLIPIAFVLQLLRWKDGTRAVFHVVFFFMIRKLHMNWLGLQFVQYLFAQLSSDFGL